MIFTPEKTQELKLLVDASSFIVIIGHRSPDGDAVGSSLALSHFLTSLGKAHQVVMPDAFPPFLNWLPGSKDILLHDGNVDRVSEAILKADLIFCLDFNRLDRVGAMSKVLIESKSKKILVDHHLHPSNDFLISFSQTDASSTCELVFRLVEAYGSIEDQSLSFMLCIYCGLLTDTGSFKYNVYPDTHRIAGYLISKGVVPSDVQSSLFDVNSMYRLKLLGHLLKERLVHVPEKNASYMTLNADDLLRYNFHPGDTEGFVNYGLSIKDCVFTALASEKDGVVKISFRSKGDVDVNVMAKEAFGGGGHKNAAGARSEGTLEEVIAIIRSIIAEKV